MADVFPKDCLFSSARHCPVWLCTRPRSSQASLPPLQRSPCSQQNPTEVALPNPPAPAPPAGFTGDTCCWNPIWLACRNSASLEACSWRSSGNMQRPHKGVQPTAPVNSQHRPPTGKGRHLQINVPPPLPWVTPRLGVFPAQKEPHLRAEFKPMSYRTHEQSIKKQLFYAMKYWSNLLWSNN